MPSLDQWMRGIAKAERAGDAEAAAYLREQAQAEMTGPGNKLEQLGAGMQDVVTGTKQLFGQTAPGEVEEHNRIARSATGGTLGGELTRGAGTAALAAPTMFIPGGQTVGGAAMIGAGTGLLLPTEDDNVIAGKAKNAALGGAAGGALQAVAAPVGRVLTRTLGKGRELARNFTAGGRQRIAEEAFTEAIPQAERAAAQQALQGAAAARTAPFAGGVSGAPVTSGVATRQPALLAAEREAREAAGALGQPFRELDDAAAQQRWAHLQANVGGDVPQLSDVAENVYNNFIQGARMAKPFDSKGRLGDQIAGSFGASKNPTIRAELERIFEQYQAARSAGDVRSLHELRMTAFDDALSRLAQSDKNAAKLLRNSIQGFKDTFDDEMNRAMGGGQWSRFLKDYSGAAQAREQARSGNALMQQLETANPTPGGAPMLTGRRQQLAREAGARHEVFDTPVHSPQASDALQTVRGEITDQMLPYTQGPRGSATAQNLSPSDRVLRRAIAAQRGGERAGSGGDVGAGVVGALTGGLAGGVALPLARRAVMGVADRQALNIAERLIQLHTNPARAAQALANMNLPPQVRSQVMQHLARAIHGPAAAGAAALANQE